MKQGKRIQMLLLVTLSGLSTIGYAQGKTCFGTAFEIKELSAPSASATFQWMENGQDIPGANSATYTIPADKPKGKYTYVRNSLKEGCEWASSNIFTVEVITCGTITSGAEPGTVGTFVDPRDNKVYKTVMMPDRKEWFAENLNYQKDLVFNQSSDAANGVPFVTAENGAPAIGSFWCPAVAWTVTSANKNTCGVYGALYTWETAMMVDGKWADEPPSSSTWDETWVSGNYYTTFASEAPTPNNNANKNNARATRGICPLGWHVPTDYEWANLCDKVEGNTSYTSNPVNGWLGTDVGAKLKSASTYLGSDTGIGAWLERGEGRGTNTTGFGALPAGRRYFDGSAFAGRGQEAVFWCSTVYNYTNATRRYFGTGNANVSRGSTSRSYAWSVRCIRD
jgi:uncharacterized protein (TIGR02145 family)